MAKGGPARLTRIAPLFSALILFAWTILCLLLPAHSANSSKPLFSTPRLNQAPTIDGELAEWSELPYLLLGADPSQVTHYSTWTGPLDCSAKLWLGWDEKALYFAAEITDNRFWQGQYDPLYLWADDSVQIAFDTYLDYSGGDYGKDDRVFGWALLGDKTSNFCWQGPEAPYLLPDLPDACRRTSAGWACEAAIPWQKLGMRPAAGNLLGFSCLINDTDLQEREGWVGLTDWGDWTIHHVPGPFIGPNSFATIALAGGTGSSPEMQVFQEQQYSAALARFQKQLTGATDPARAAEAQLWCGHLHTLYL